MFAKKFFSTCPPSPTPPRQEVMIELQSSSFAFFAIETYGSHGGKGEGGPDGTLFVIKNILVDQIANEYGLYWS